MPTYILREPCLPVLKCLLVHGSHTPVLYGYVCTKSDHSQAGIEPRPTINCYCRPQKCYPCSMSASQGIAAVQNICIRLLLHFHLFKSHPGSCKLAGATYSAMRHIYRSIAIPISYHGYICSYIRTFNMLMHSTNSNARLGFSYLGHPSQHL